MGKQLCRRGLPSRGQKTMDIGLITKRGTHTLTQRCVVKNAWIAAYLGLQVCFTALLLHNCSETLTGKQPVHNGLFVDIE